MFKPPKRVDKKKVDGGDPFQGTVSGPGGVVACQVVDNHNGTYAVSYALPGPGTYTVSVKLQNREIKGSPYTQTSL